MNNPILMPSRLVEKNRSKTRSGISAGNPVPKSRTHARTAPSPSRSVNDIRAGVTAPRTTLEFRTLNPEQVHVAAGAPAQNRFGFDRRRRLCGSEFEFQTLL
jgi:hypothetical protein